MPSDPTWSRLTAAPPVSFSEPDAVAGAPCLSAGATVSVQLYVPFGTYAPVDVLPFQDVRIASCAAPSDSVRTVAPVALFLSTSVHDAAGFDSHHVPSHEDDESTRLTEGSVLAPRSAMSVAETPLRRTWMSWEAGST